MDNADDRPLPMDERDRNGPNGIAGGETPRSIDWIDDQNEIVVHTSRQIGGFFGEPAGFRYELTQTLLKQEVRSKIGFGDRRAIRFFLYTSDSFLARPEISARNFAGGARGLNDPSDE